MASSSSSEVDDALGVMPLAGETGEVAEVGVVAMVGVVGVADSADGEEGTRLSRGREPFVFILFWVRV